MTAQLPGVGLKVQSTNVSLTTSYSRTELSGMPFRVLLGVLQLSVDTMASSPTTITAYLSTDANGDHIVGNLLNLPIRTEGATANTGGCSADYEGAPFSWDTGLTMDDTLGSLWLNWKLDVGTANGQAKLTYKIGTRGD